MQTNVTTTQIQNLNADVLLNKLEIIDNHYQDIKDILNQPKNDELLTIGEVCRILKVSKVSVYNWCNHKILKPYKIGNQTRFKHSEVLEALQAKHIGK